MKSDQRQDVAAIISKIKNKLPINPWIWTQELFSNQFDSNPNDYLLYSRCTLNDETIWAIGNRKDVVWLNRTDKPDSEHPVPRPSETFPLLFNSDYNSICKLHANYKAMIEENERLKQEMETLNSVTKRLNGSLRTEQEAHESLKETHQQVLVIGCAFVSLLVVFMVIIGVFFRNRIKRNIDKSENDGSEAVKQYHIAAVLGDHRRKSQAVEGLDDHFGMNEISKVTAKEGSDLVRIARPLETEGAERKLSEELLGIVPIISDGNGQARQRNRTVSNTESVGEESASL